MSNVVPELFGQGCDHELPAWGVTRQFEFGQFVILYDEREVKGKRVVTPVVLSDEGDIVVPETPGGTKGAKSTYQAASTATGGVPLHLLYETEDAVELVLSTQPKTLTVPDLGPFLKEGAIEVGGTKYTAELGADAKDALAQGQPVTVIGHAIENGTERRELLQFAPAVRDVTVRKDELNTILASRSIPIDGAPATVHFSSDAADALLAGRGAVVTATREGENPRLVRIQPEGDGSRPATTRLVVSDLGSFVAEPAVPSLSAGSLPVGLTADRIEELRTGGRTMVEVGGVGVEISVQPEDPNGGRLPMPTSSLPAPLPPEIGSPIGTTPFPDDVGGGTIPYVPSGGRAPLEWQPGGYIEAWKPWMENGGLATTGTAAPTSEPQMMPRKGLQLAILLPWQQRWKLDGFSRGSLISSIALGPAEETTITIASWERRAKALEQSTETETEQQVDFTQTTRDTDDVFREMTSRHDFQWQVHGNVDASYSNGVASIRVGVNGGVDNTDSLSSVLRTTHNHLRETTNRASTKVRARRITKITETVERGVSQEVVRRIRNPNDARTLTLDFHEVLAHYTIETKFLSPRIRIVVLVPNPISADAFTPLLIRKNETALRNALLDSALADAFDACRLLTSYEFAKTELREVAAAAKQVAELEKPRVKDTQNQKPPNPHTQKVLDILKDVGTIAGQLQGVDIQPAMTAIGKHQTVSETQRTAGQRWLFVQLCRAKLAPAFMNALLGLAGKQPTIGDAQAFLDTAPAPGAYPSLGDLNDLPDSDKENAGLDVKIKSQPGYIFWDWGWWTGQLRTNRLYRADDAGLANKIARLREAWQDYAAKEAEGAGIEAGNQMVGAANQQQDEANYMDKLEMKYGLEIVASARERVEALLGHLNDHLDYYRYVLFQALPPGEQLRRLMDVAPQLRVGMFEPHVVAMNGGFLAVPLTPLGKSKLETTLTTLQKVLDTAGKEAEEAGAGIVDDTVILPTPGISVEAWLGRCDAIEPHLKRLRNADGRRVEADARRLELEADRIAKRLESTPPLLDDPAPGVPAVLNVRLDKPDE